MLLFIHEKFTVFEKRFKQNFWHILWHR